MTEEKTNQARRLIAFCDGTWNGAATQTNIKKLSTFITDSPDQKVGYFQGVGLHNDFAAPRESILGQAWSALLEVSRQLPEFLLNGALADDIKTKITEVYSWLIKHYDEEKPNEIWLFGFSRGAYTARCVAGMIRNCGLLKKGHENLVDEAYRWYRSRDCEHHPDSEESKTFRQSVSHENIRIHFMGLFDTVGSLGIPVHITGTGFEHLQFFDENLPNIVDYAYQALAAHSRSDFFRPTHIRKRQTNTTTNLEERWFPGVHYDIGGFGFDIGDERLTNASLWWIMQKIQERERYEKIQVINTRVFDQNMCNRISTNEGVTDNPTWIKWIKSKFPIHLIGDPHPNIPLYTSSLHDRIIDCADNQVTCLYNDGDWSSLRSRQYLKDYYPSNAYENFVTRVQARPPLSGFPQRFLDYLDGQ